jgi:hypothetical protein
LALANALSPFSNTIRYSRVDVFVDNSALLHAWNRQGARSHAFSDALKKVFWCSKSANLVLNLEYVPSSLSKADLPSRSLSLLDAQLARGTWLEVQRAFGRPSGHSTDLMATPSNVMSSYSGSPLPFFSPYPSVGCLGVNIFSQLPRQYSPALFANPCVFHPICLIPHVVQAFTIVVPDIQPGRSWCPVIYNLASSQLLLARRGQVGPILVPSKSGFTARWAPPWDLWAFRIGPQYTG